MGKLERIGSEILSITSADGWYWVNIEEGKEILYKVAFWVTERHVANGNFLDVIVGYDASNTIDSCEEFNSFDRYEYMPTQTPKPKQKL